jgi:hypothetical protein
MVDVEESTCQTGSQRIAAVPQSLLRAVLPTGLKTSHQAPPLKDSIISHITTPGTKLPTHETLKIKNHHHQQHPNLSTR